LLQLAVIASGMVTPVGFSAASSCAAMRAGIDGGAETRFMFDGQWLTGCVVPFAENCRGREKLVQMAMGAIRECFDAAGDIPSHEIPLLLCLAEPNRPGGFTMADASLLGEIQDRLGYRFHPESQVIARGRVGGVEALACADALIKDRRPLVIFAGVDSFLNTPTLSAYHALGRLKTEENSDGFIPGEAGAAVLVGAPGRTASPELRCLGIGWGKEPAYIGADKPIKADGLVQAIRHALQDSGCTYKDLDYRITDLSGEQYGFKEAALALLRTMRDLKCDFDIWHPAEFIGEAGAAMVPVILGQALAAVKKGYAVGTGVLCHVASDAEVRAAWIVRYQ
jgi:3-oxoacyl-[acyl-carrier-protein] synthase-1